MPIALLFRVLRASTFATAILGTCSLASAQQYQSDPVEDKAGALKLIVEQCVKNPGRFATDRGQFNEFFANYYFPAMTRNAPDDLAKLGGMRDDLFSRFLWASTDENLQQELTQMAFKKVQPVERNRDERNQPRNYHPAVRYNAILILGMLDETYPIAAGPNRRPSVPLKEATKELSLVVDYAAQGKPVPQFLVVGALVGLQRHAQFHESLDKASVDAITAAVVKLATKDDVLPEADAKVVEWIQLQAATVLANLGNPGPKGEAQAVLAKMVAGQTAPKMSLDARGQVAALLARMKYEGATVDGAATADAMLKLAVDVATDEARLAKEFDDSQIMGGGYGGGFGGPASRRRGRIKYDLETQLAQFDVRVLLARLSDLRGGLSAAKPIVPADKQAVFDAVIAAINPVVTAAQNSDAVGLEISRAVQTMATEIQNAVKPGSAPAETTDPGAVF